MVMVNSYSFLRLARARRPCRVFYKRSGSRLRIKYERGQWATRHSGPFVDGAGEGGAAQAPAPVPGSSFMCLAGRIGPGKTNEGGSVFVVGSGEHTLDAASEGYIYLFANDGKLSDNTGELVVSFTYLDCNQSPKPVLTARPFCRWRPNWRFQAAMALAASSCGSGISSPSNAA